MTQMMCYTISAVNKPFEIQLQCLEYVGDNQQMNTKTISVWCKFGEVRFDVYLRCEQPGFEIHIFDELYAMGNYIINK